MSEFGSCLCLGIAGKVSPVPWRFFPVRFWVLSTFLIKLPVSWPVLKLARHVELCCILVSETVTPTLPNFRLAQQFTNVCFTRKMYGRRPVYIIDKIIFYLLQVSKLRQTFCVCDLQMNMSQQPSCQICPPFL
jgi:hypothetical protein